jgi:hypothetical protein
VEEGVPWNRLLIYGIQQNVQVYRILYNNTYFYRTPSDMNQGIMQTSKYILMYFFKKSDYLISANVRLYDSLNGTFVGYLIIPSHETCRHVRRHVPIPLRPADDMTLIVFFCPLQPGWIFSSYQSVKRYTRKGLFYKLLYCNKVTLPEVRYSFDAYFFFLDQPLGVFVLPSETYDMKLLIFHNMGNDSTPTQKHILSIRGRFSHISTSTSLGIFLLRYLHQLVAIEISCFSRRALAKNEGARILQVEMNAHGSRSDRQDVFKHVRDREVIFYGQRDKDIFKIQKDGQGNFMTYAMVAVYSRYN